MNKIVFSLILLSVLMSSLAQIVLKSGMSSASVSRALASGENWTAATGVATNPMVLLGLAIYFLGAIVWLLVLARVDVSLAYPFVGLGFVVTMILGRVVHGEVLTLERIGGTLLIALGVVVLARSH